MTIAELQQKIRDRATTAPLHTEVKQPELVDYTKLETPELQDRYNKLEQWMLLNKNHPRYYVAEIRIKQINKVLASRIKM